MGKLGYDIVMCRKDGSKDFITHGYDPEKVIIPVTGDFVVIDKIRYRCESREINWAFTRVSIILREDISEKEQI